MYDSQLFFRQFGKEGGILDVVGSGDDYLFGAFQSGTVEGRVQFQKKFLPDDVGMIGDEEPPRSPGQFPARLGPRIGEMYVHDVRLQLFQFFGKPEKKIRAVEMKTSR